MGRFQTNMQAEVRVPQEGFTLDDLKAHLKATRIPADARLKPAKIRTVDPNDAYDSQFTPQDPVPETEEIGFIAEWRA